MSPADGDAGAGSGLIALVTGATRGIGLEVARQLGRRGAAVLLGARDAVRGKQEADALAAEGLAASAVRLDVTDPESVAAVAAEIHGRYGRLDVLVNNAGIADDPAGRGSRAERLRRVYETNVVGVVAVTDAMLPLLRRSPAARIVNVSSTAASLTLNADPESGFAGYHDLPYQTSKTALNAVTVAYAKELRADGIAVNAANPGFTATAINGFRGHRTPAQGAAVAVRLALLGPGGPTATSQDDDGPVPW